MNWTDIKSLVKAAVGGFRAGVAGWRDARDALHRVEVGLTDLNTTPVIFERGINLADTVVKVGLEGDLFEVGRHIVDFRNAPPSCTCEWAEHRPDIVCKHVIACATFMGVGS